MNKLLLQVLIQNQLLIQLHLLILIQFLSETPKLKLRSEKSLRRRQSEFIVFFVGFQSSESEQKLKLWTFRSSEESDIEGMEVIGEDGEDLQDEEEVEEVQTLI